MGDLRRLRSSTIWLVLIVAVIALWFLVVDNDESTTNKDFSAVAQEIEAGRVHSLEMTEGLVAKGGQPIVKPSFDVESAKSHARRTRKRSQSGVRDATDGRSRVG